LQQSLGGGISLKLAGMEAALNFFFLHIGNYFTHLTTKTAHLDVSVEV